MRIRICLPLLLAFFLIHTFTVSADNNWASRAENPKAFIENKGQFHTNSSNDNVLYAYDNSGTMIYFTSKGLVYRFIEEVLKNKDEKEKEREREREKSFKTVEEWKEHEAEEHKRNYKIDYVNFYWENSNPNVQIIAEEPTADYHSYTFEEKGEFKNINYIKGFKKLIYKNLYENIDVEYVFHPLNGIKYTLVLHPGADVSKVKMLYDDVKLKNNGDLNVTTLFGDIVEHAPLTFYADNKDAVISSRFIKNGKSIQFQLGSYDVAKTIYIDPWVQTPALSNSNCVWECERDGAGNVYIIGGDVPMKLRKYNSAGTIQWTYNTPWDTVSDQNSTTGDWLGTLATDLAGNSYITNGSSAALQKISTSGSMLYNAAGGSIAEYWNITFNCDQTKLIVGGTTGSFGVPPNLYGAIFDINTSDGSVLSTKIVGYGSTTSFPPSIQEVRSITPSRNAKYYFLTLDTVGCVNQNFSACSSAPPLFKINSTYGLSYKCENYRPDNGNAGIKAIKANKNFVYTLNGATIHKRSLANGSVITSASIPGGNTVSSGGQNQLANAGIDIDSCGNVYVGSGNAVIKYDANLTQLSSTSLPFKVYDVAVSNGGDIIVCGGTGTNANTSRTGYVQSINMSACDPMILECCDATVCPAGPYCVTDAPTTLTPVVAGGTWSGSGITNASAGTFDPSVAGAGVHTIIYTLACGSDSVTISVSNCIALTACQESNGNITATSGTAPYSWLNQTTTQNCSACFFGCSAPPGCAVNVTAWSSFATGTTITPSGTYPVKLLDNNGDSLIITSLSTLPNCPSSGCPTITTTASSIVNVSCPGLSDGSFNAAVTGGVSPYDYTLNITGGAQVATFSNVTGTQNFTGLVAGDYTLYTNDNNNCADTIEVTITEPSGVSITATAGPDQTVCSNSAILSGNTPSTGVGTWTVISGTATITTPSSPTSAITGVAVGVATLVWTINDGCASASDTVSITNTGGGPVVSVSSYSNISCNSLNDGTATVTATGGTGVLVYAWAPSGGSASTASNLQAGTYTISVSDDGGCTGIETVTITEPDAITLNVVATAAGCAGGGTANASAAGGTGLLIYAWNTGENTSSITGLAAGSYTVAVTDSMGCTVSDIATVVAASGSITATISENDTIAFGQSIQLNSGGGSNYVWSPATGLDCSTCRNPIATPLETTVYCVIVSDNGCADTACVTITIEEGNCETNFYTGGAFYIPNAFTPNNDILNDYFKPLANCIKDYTFTVFNRWGEKLFETTDVEQGWNGYYKGDVCHQDVYVYKVSFIDEVKGNYHEYIGKFLLVK
ncbi:MAG: T9SS type B sorting domain-containing protein [Bacteroidia bacterium]